MFPGCLFHLGVCINTKNKCPIFQRWARVGPNITTFNSNQPVEVMFVLCSVHVQQHSDLSLFYSEDAGKNEGTLNICILICERDRSFSVILLSYQMVGWICFDKLHLI